MSDNAILAAMRREVGTDGRSEMSGTVFWPLLGRFWTKCSRSDRSLLNTNLPTRCATPMAALITVLRTYLSAKR